MDAAELKVFLVSVGQLTPAQRAALLATLQASGRDWTAQRSARTAKAAGSSVTAAPVDCSATNATAAGAPSTR